VKTRVQSEAGFGLIELLIAMVVLNIGILAMVAAFNSGIVSLARSSHVTTASALADQQMELYRALTYGCIYLTAAGTSPYWTGDTTFNVGTTYTTTCASPPTKGSGSYALDSKAAVQNVVGADGHRYELDTYVIQCAAGNVTPCFLPAGSGPNVKRVSIAVHDTLTGHVWAREQSTFDQSTGQ